MSRISISAGTPCPAPPYNSSSSSSTTTLAGKDHSLANFPVDDTLASDFEYTRADLLQREFRAARPMRRCSVVGMRRTDRRGAGVKIFEDVVEEEDEEEMAGFEERLPGRTLLSRKAMRVPGPGAKDKVVVQQQQREPSALGGEGGQARRLARISMMAASAEGHDARSGGGGDGLVGTGKMEQARERAGLKKDPRRRTIFVPPDDTTMLTIHPGADATARLDDTFHVPGISAAFTRPVMQRSPEQGPGADGFEPGRGSRRSRMSLAAAPKRLPLQQMWANEGNVLGLDVDGQNGGKENMAPKCSGLLLTAEEKPAKAGERKVVLDSAAAPSSRLFEPTAASQARRSIMARNAVSLRRPAESTKSQSQRKPGLSWTSSARLNAGQTTASKLPSGCSPIVEVSSATSADRRDSCATKKRAPPKAFRGWLGHQETSMTELINNIFEHAMPTSFDDGKNQVSLREQLIATYHQPHVSTLHQRLQASLLYGALARPKDASSLPHPAYDIGLRKQFLGLWLNNYTEYALRAAAEVVTGRQAPRKSCSLRGGLDSSETLLDPAKSRRALTGFLETFLVTVEDVATDGEHGTGDLSARRWRKTILRSLMLIWLLDQAKLSGYIKGCLFKRTASKKSSVIILNWLASMLMPGTGDISRTLRYLDYEVSHVQDPLDEVVYRIDNLAIDLRDGIILSRLMEILLFSSQNVAVSHQSTVNDATITIRLPDATVLESEWRRDDGSQCSRVLSQHLKMPCLGRAQRLYNVQVALSALDQVSGMSQAAAQDLSAEDIVNGHREKTINFLWALVSSHGLSTLVDWEELKLDIRRSSQTTCPPSNSLPHSDADWLKAWAAVHGNRAGLTITNLTTSFADGEAYTAIVDAFASSLPGQPARSHSTQDNPNLETGLRALGCSTPFIKQLTTPLGLIPSETTTISNLAFLASRLLPLARRQNAAVILQRYFRCRQARTMMTRRVALIRMAHACAAVVNIRQIVIDAAVVLQRRWRAVLHGRIERLQGDVRGFQAVARAWKVRKIVRKEVRRAGFESRREW
nr:abnormal spindle-like microcephaly-associated protein like [Quercus suber]